MNILKILQDIEHFLLISFFFIAIIIGVIFALIPLINWIIWSFGFGFIMIFIIYPICKICFIAHLQLLEENDEK